MSEETEDKDNPLGAWPCSLQEPPRPVVLCIPLPSFPARSAWSSARRSLPAPGTPQTHPQPLPPMHTHTHTHTHTLTPLPGQGLQDQGARSADALGAEPVSGSCSDAPSNSSHPGRLLWCLALLLLQLASLLRSHPRLGCPFGQLCRSAAFASSLSSPPPCLASTPQPSSPLLSPPHLIPAAGRKLSAEQFLGLSRLLTRSPGAAGRAAGVLLGVPVTQAAARAPCEPRHCPAAGRARCLPSQLHTSVCAASVAVCLVVCFFSAAGVCSSFSITCSGVIPISCSISSPSPGKGKSAPGICPRLPL